MTTFTTQDRIDAERPSFYEIVITDQDEPYYVLRFYTNKMLGEGYWKISYEEFMEHVDVMKQHHKRG